MLNLDGYLQCTYGWGIPHPEKWIIDLEKWKQSRLLLLNLPLCRHYKCYPCLFTRQKEKSSLTKLLAPVCLKKIIRVHWYIKPPSFITHNIPKDAFNCKTPFSKMSVCQCNVQVKWPHLMWDMTFWSLSIKSGFKYHSKRWLSKFLHWKSM